MTTANGGGTRDAILHAALKVISRFGYADASVGDIAAEAGVNNVTVYRLFGGKENLFQEVVARYADVRPDTGAWDAVLRRKTGDGFLLELAARYFEVVFGNIDIFRIFIVESPHFDFVRRAAWFIPPALLDDCVRRFISLVPASSPPASGRMRGGVERAAEMFLSQVVRSALQYNKHDSLWEYTDSLAADFRRAMAPRARFMAAYLAGFCAENREATT